MPISLNHFTICKKKEKSYNARINARIPAPIGIPNPRKRRSKEITFLKDA